MFTKGEQLNSHTTLKVGGEAEYYVEVRSEAELVAAVTAARERGLSFRVLGGGSNLLVSDNGVSGLVIKNSIVGSLSEQREDQVRLTVAAGETLDDIVGKTVTAGWWGLENLSHVPGTVGATPVQNVGAYGVEVKDLIERVRALDTNTMEFVMLSNADCEFGYRDSIFKQEAGKSYIITAVTFILTTKPTAKVTYRDLAEVFQDKQPSLTEVRAAVIAIRSKKFPDWQQVGTAGSFFKNPIVTKEQYESLQQAYPGIPGYLLGDGSVKLPLGWVLDKVMNYKGLQEGAVGTYQGQALVIVNHGGATATEVENFANKIISSVKEKINVAVEWEVTRW